jgi:general secretion pathway protein D
MFESKSRVVLLILSTVVFAAASAQQPTPLPQQGQPQIAPQGATVPPQGAIQIMPAQVVPTPVTSPEIAAAEAEAATRRYEDSVDLHALVAEVAESTGKEFLIDPRVRARIYAVPRIENPTYPTLLSVLRLNGYIAVEIGGKVNIMPDASARSQPSRLLQRDDDSVPDDEIVTRVITVPNAANLVPILRPMMPQYAHLAAGGGSSATDPPNKLIITDTYANVRRITELVETLRQ